MVERLEKAGLSFAAKDETGKRMEVCFFFVNMVVCFNGCVSMIFFMEWINLFGVFICVGKGYLI